MVQPTTRTVVPHGGCTADGGRVRQHTFFDDDPVAAGYGVGFTSAWRIWPVAIRLTSWFVRWSIRPPSLTTFLLRLEGEIAEPLQQFIDRGACGARAKRRLTLDVMREIRIARFYFV